jgi:two-component system sensor histidine kinase/response regulator
MNVRTKLIIGFSVIVILLWLIAFFTSTNYWNLNQQFRDVEEEIISETLFISNIESLASETYRGTLDYMFHGSEKAKLDTLSLLDLLVRIEETNLSPSDDINPQLSSAIDKYYLAITNVIATKDSGATVEDLMVMDQIIGLPALVSLQQAANVQKMHNSEQLAIAEADFNKTYTTGLRSTLISIALITLVALVAAILTTRSIIKPLNKLRKGTEMIAKGNLSYKVGTTASDEIGQLSRAFDQMTEGLTNTMTSIDNLNTEITERKKVEFILKEERQRAQNYLDIAGTMLLALDSGGKVSLVNKKGCEILEYDEKDIINKDWFDNFLPETMKHEIKEVFKKIMGGDISNFSYVGGHAVISKSGKEKMIAWHNSLIRDEKGEIIGTLSSGEDITERKQAEDALRESEEKFSVAFRSSPHPMAISSLKTSKFIEVNNSFARVTGYTRDEVIGRKASDLNFWVNIDERDRILNTLKEQGRVDSLEYLLRTKSGEIHNLMFSAEPITIFGEECMISITTDITDRKQTMEALRESEEKYRTVLENADIGIIVVQDNKFVFSNPWIHEMLGYNEEEFFKTDFISLVHPGDRPKAIKRMNAFYMGKTTTHPIEMRVISKSGKIKWIETSVVKIQWQGKPALQSFIIDVTERKQAEEALKVSQEFNTGLLENAPHQIVVINPDTSIRYVNPKFEEVNGWTLEEIVGTRAPYPWWTDELRTEEAIEGFKEAIKMDVGQVETMARKKNGEIYWLDLNWVAVKHEEELQYCLINSIDITEHKKIDEALKESEEKFSKAFRSSPNAIVITTIKEGRFIDVNDSFIDLTGYTREEVIGNTAENLNIWARIKDREEMLRVLKKDGRVHNHEYNFRIKSGEIRTWLFSAELIDIGNEPCNISMNLDITEQKRAEEALKESEEFSSSIMRNSAIPILVINEDTSVRYVNPSFEKLTGFTSAEVVGEKAPMPWWINGPDLENNGNYQKAILKGVCGKERLFQKKNGDQFWVEVTSAPVKLNGKFVYSLSNWLDITGRKQMENELRVHRDHLEELVRERTVELTDLNKRLQHELKERQKAEVALLAAKDEAETANQAKSEFLARTSHEIRTPIHGVMGTINLVLDSKLEHDQRQYLKMAISSAEALLSIINDILDLSKIESGQLEPEREGFDLRTTLEDTLDSMAVTAHNKGLELTCHLLGGVTTDLIGDPRHLRQVLINLIGNSIKFTEKGEVALYVEPIADSKKETELHFTVRDTGIGIPRNKFDIIFEPFQQADGSINRKYGGTGLGLTISRHLINQMGGRIWVEKGSNKGSIFHFTGKFTKQTNGKHSGNGSKNMLSVQNFPLLLVDDNVTNRLMVKDILVNWGFDVTDVESGSTALKVIADAGAKSVQYRIIMLDKTMDDMDGFAVAEQMLNNSTMPSDIIMMLPPNSVSDDFSRCQKLGISNYLIKPIKESELQKALLTAIGKAPDSKEKTEKTIHKHVNVPSLRILVAEDNTTSQLIARKTLEKIGHHVEIAQNGSEAVKMTEKGNFDLILMDAEMPILNGLEATRLIRKSEGVSGRHIPIIAMTAYAMKEDKKKCLDAGMDGYLAKPAKPAEINAIVTELFAGKENLVNASKSFSEVEIKEIPTVDIEAAMKIFGGDDDLLREAVGLFLEEDYPQQIKLLREGIERKDADAVKAAAHSIKGAVRSLGGMVLGDIALRLEELGREGKLKGARELANKLEDEINHFADYYTQSAKS